MIDLNFEYLLPIILYAETHYKFKGIYSRLIKDEPEIIADAPYRVDPQQAIPVLVLIKDAHRFPIKLMEVSIEVKTKDRSLSKKSFLTNTTITEAHFWHQIFYIEPITDFAGAVEIDVRMTIQTNRKIEKYSNDNYRISTHRPLSCYLAKEPLPRFENWYFGDFHYHSNYTEDQVEFGAPLEATVHMARAIGLNFFAVTDHSYDLDDQENSWIENDHRAPKWHQLWDEVEKRNHQLSDFVILPGEEVSAGNHQNRNVHLLILNNRKFFPGKGDSAERWLRTAPDLSIDLILDQLEESALAIAGHPEMPVPFLQWLLIRRGRWQRQDFNHQRLAGFQIWNGKYDDSFYHGSGRWVQLLLEGKKLSLIAGNDAHGNFNRFRQIGFPFFTLRESITQLFGNMRTGVRLNDRMSLSNLIAAVKLRHVLISNGPIVDFLITNERGEMSAIGDEIGGRQFNFVMNAKSTEEFGRLKRLRIIAGNLKTKAEQAILTIDDFSTPYKFALQQQFQLPLDSGYARIELTAQQGEDQVTRCLTNPIWINKIL